MFDSQGHGNQGRSGGTFGLTIAMPQPFLTSRSLVEAWYDATRMSGITIHQLQALFAEGRFDISGHGVPHRWKEGFSIAEIVEAIRRGQIIEEYPWRNRCLVWGRARTAMESTLDLHVVCDVSDPEWVHVVTAYVPDPLQWESPPARRKK